MSSEIANLARFRSEGARNLAELSELGRDTSSGENPGWGTFGIVKPPICEVCNVRFSAKGGAPVTCLGDEASAAFEKRAETAGFVGHPPNKGWFCPEHRAVAEHMGTVETRSNVVRVIRASEKTRICAACEASFVEGTGGVVSFAHTPEGLEWSRGSCEGTSPDDAWLCRRHISPALLVSRTLERPQFLTRSEALAELRPDGRPPLEYDEKPPSAARDAEPRRGFGLPVMDGGLEGATERWIPIAPHPPKAVDAVVHSARNVFGAAFGVDGFTNSSSSSSTNIDPADVRWASPGTWVGSGYTPHQAGDVTVFTIRQLFRDGHRQGPIIARGHRLLIQQREQSMFEMTLVPADPPTVALDGLVMIERVLIRQNGLVDRATSAALERAVDTVVSELATAPEDPLALEPDLVGVDLGSGTVIRKSFPKGSRIEWEVQISFEEVLGTVVGSTDRFLDGLGIDAEVEFERSTVRNWNPMDGAHPPDCPFDDTTTYRSESGVVEVDVVHRSTHWNEESIANRSVSLFIRVAGVERLYVSVVDQPDTDTVTLMLNRPTSAGAVATVRSVFDC